MEGATLGQDSDFVLSGSWECVDMENVEDEPVLESNAVAPVACPREAMGSPMRKYRAVGAHAEKQGVYSIEEAQSAFSWNDLFQASPSQACRKTPTAREIAKVENSQVESTKRKGWFSWLHGVPEVAQDLSHIPREPLRESVGQDAASSLQEHPENMVEAWALHSDADMHRSAHTEVQACGAIGNDEPAWNANQTVPVTEETREPTLAEVTETSYLPSAFLEHAVCPPASIAAEVGNNYPATYNEFESASEFAAEVGHNYPATYNEFESAREFAAEVGHNYPATYNEFESASEFATEVGHNYPATHNEFESASEFAAEVGHDYPATYNYQQHTTLTPLSPSAPIATVSVGSHGSETSGVVGSEMSGRDICREHLAAAASDCHQGALARDLLDTQPLAERFEDTQPLAERFEDTQPFAGGSNCQDREGMTLLLCTEEGEENESEEEQGQDKEDVEIGEDEHEYKDGDEREDEGEEEDAHYDKEFQEDVEVALADVQEEPGERAAGAAEADDNRSVSRYTQVDRDAVEPYAAKLMQAADIPSRNKGSAVEFRRLIDEACDLTSDSLLQRSMKKAAQEFRQSNERLGRIALDRLIAKVVFDKIANLFTDFQQTEESCLRTREMSHRYSQVFLRMYLHDPPCPKLAELPDELRPAASKYDADVQSRLKTCWCRFLESHSMNTDLRAVRLRDLLDGRLHNRLNGMSRRVRKGAKTDVSNLSADSERTALVNSFTEWLTPKMTSEMTVRHYSRCLRDFLNKRNSPETMANKQCANAPDHYQQYHQATLGHFSRFWTSNEGARTRWQRYVKHIQELVQQFQQYLKGIALKNKTRSSYVAIIQSLFGLPAQRASGVSSDMSPRSLVDTGLTIDGLSMIDRAALKHFRDFWATR